MEMSIREKAYDTIRYILEEIFTCTCSVRDIYSDEHSATFFCDNCMNPHGKTFNLSLIFDIDSSCNNLKEYFESFLKYLEADPDGYLNSLDETDTDNEDVVKYFFKKYKALTFIFKVISGYYCSNISESHFKLDEILSDIQTWDL
jgi:hypothetical protein